MTVTQQAAFRVIGIATRASNSRIDRIGELWGRFMSEGVYPRIPGMVDPRVVGVYTDYAADEHGEFTLIAGVRVSQDAEVPEGMTAVDVPAGTYAAFQSERGPADVVVAQAWQQVWAQTLAPRYVRSFRCDYEIYAADGTAADTSVEIFVSLE